MNNLKKFVFVLCAALILAGAVAVQANELKSDKLFQVALLQSLMQGEYDGVITVGDLKNYGDTGIGTFQSVNGELIMLDGVVYRALWDGSVEVAADDETVPFSNVTFFDADIKREKVNAASIQELKEILTSVANQQGKNQFYMAKVKGLMPSMFVRSELPQEKPYKTLNAALETDQREFSYENISGTIVALYCPEYMDGLNTPGWHLHFISDDGKKGGHVLGLSAKDCEIELDIISEFAMIVPNRSTFDGKDLAKDLKEEIKKVEQKDN